MLNDSVLTKCFGHHVKRTDIPPSTLIALPVIKLDRSESRNKAACAISFGVAIRFMGCKLAMNSKAAGCTSPPLGVLLPPDTNHLTRMPPTALSNDHDLPKPIQPPT